MSRIGAEGARTNRFSPEVPSITHASRLNPTIYLPSSLVPRVLGILAFCIPIQSNKSCVLEPTMSNQEFDPMELSENQQLALGTYTSVTNQDPSAAVPLLQRSEWNVQVCHTLQLIREDEQTKADEVIRLLSLNSSTGKHQTQ